MRSEYADHGLKPGHMVHKVTMTNAFGRFVYLYLYDTAVSFEKEGYERRGWEYTIEYVPWDGVTEVSCYNGD